MSNDFVCIFNSNECSMIPKLQNMLMFLFVISSKVWCNLLKFS